MAVMADETTIADTFNVHLSDNPKPVEVTAEFILQPLGDVRTGCKCAGVPHQRTPGFRIRTEPGHVVNGIVWAQLDYVPGRAPGQPSLVFGWRHLAVNSIPYYGYAGAGFNDNGDVEIDYFHQCRDFFMAAPPTRLGKKRCKEFVTELAEDLLPRYEVRQMWRTHVRQVLREEVERAEAQYADAADNLTTAQAHLAGFNPW